MSVTVQWDDESCTILRVDYAGRWTICEVRTAFEVMNRLIADAVETPALLLNHLSGYVPPRYGFDLIQSDGFPLSACGLPELVVFVGNPLAFELYDALRRPLSVQGQLHMVWTSTLAGAREWVARARSGEPLPNYSGQPVFAN